MKALKWVDKNFEVIFMVLTLIAVSAIMTAQIIARRFMGTSIAWSEEMCRYLFIWMGFLSISHSVRAKSIIKLDIVELLLPPRSKKRPVRWSSTGSGGVGDAAAAAEWETRERENAARRDGSRGGAAYRFLSLVNLRRSFFVG